MRKLPGIVTLAAALLLVTGCKEKREAPSAPSSAKAAAPASASAAAEGKGNGKSAGPKTSRRHAVRSLYTEASRAELDAGGLLIDLGSPDQHKYTLSGVNKEWGEAARDGQTTYLAPAPSGQLTVHLREPAANRLLVRARGARGPGILAVKVDGKQAGEVKVPAAWAWVAAPLKERLSAGRHTIELIQSGQAGGRLQYDKVWLPRSEDATAPPPARKVAARNHGEPMRSLVGDAPRALSYYLDLPARGALSFKYAADGATTFEVWVTVDGADPVKAFSAEGGKAWAPGKADLSAFGGKLARVDLVTRSGAGKPARASWGEPAVTVPGPRPAMPPVPRDKAPRNLLHFVVDAGRQDAYAAFDPASKVKSPAVSRLARQGVRFLNAYNNATWTLPSVFTIFSSRYPHDLADEGQLNKIPDDAPLMPEHLKKHGFATGAFSANSFISRPFGLHRGWDRLETRIIDHEPADAEELIRLASEWLESEDRDDGRFYLYIHIMEPHGPYRYHDKTTPDYMSGKYRGKLGKKFTNEQVEKVQDRELKLASPDRRYVTSLYRGEVAHGDIWLGKLLQRLEQLKLLEDTLVVFSNDHGEEVWDRGILGHGHTTKEEVIRTPLVLRYPRLLKAGQVVKRPVETVDLAPTLLELLGVPPMRGSHGVSLRNTLYGAPGAPFRYAFLHAEHWVVRLGDYKIEQGREVAELFNLATDPGERKNLLATHLVARRACEVMLGESMAVPRKATRLTGVTGHRGPAAQPAEIDSKLRKQLKALGYIEE